MSHWMCDDKSPVLPLRDLRPMCIGRPPEPKGDHSQVSQKGSNYFLRIDPNVDSLFMKQTHESTLWSYRIFGRCWLFIWF